MKSNNICLHSLSLCMSFINSKEKADKKDSHYKI